MNIPREVMANTNIKKRDVAVDFVKVIATLLLTPLLSLLTTHRSLLKAKDSLTLSLFDSLTHSSEVRLLNRASYLSNEEFDSIYNDSDEILKLLISITKTLKDNK